MTTPPPPDPPDTSLVGPVVVTPSPLRRDEPGSEWHDLTEDSAAVIAAVEHLAADFRLGSLAPGEWTLHVHEPEVSGYLVIVPRGETTAIGLRLGPGSDAEPSRPRSFLEELVVVAIIITPLWLIEVLLLWLMGRVSGWALLLGPLIPVLALVLLALGIAKLRDLWIRRRATRWCDDWRARFWPAVRARLTPGPLYR